MTKEILFSCFSYSVFVEGKKKHICEKLLPVLAPTTMFYGVKLTFVCLTEVLLFVMQLILLTFAI